MSQRRFLGRDNSGLLPKSALCFLNQAVLDDRVLKCYLGSRLRRFLKFSRAVNTTITN